MSTFLLLRRSVVLRASFGTVSGGGYSCAPFRSSVAANSISLRSDDWAMPMVSLASGLVEFEKVNSELTMVVVESDEMSECIESVYDAMVAAMRGLANCHSGGGGFAPTVFYFADLLDALSCCDLEIGFDFW